MIVAWLWGASVPRLQRTGRPFVHVPWVVWTEVTVGGSLNALTWRTLLVAAGPLSATVMV